MQDKDSHTLCLLSNIHPHIFNPELIIPDRTIFLNFQATWTYMLVMLLLGRGSVIFKFQWFAAESAQLFNLLYLTEASS